MKSYRVYLPGRVEAMDDPNSIAGQVMRELADPTSQPGKEYIDALAKIAAAEVLDPVAVARINIR